MRKYFNKETIFYLILFIIQSLMVVLCFTIPVEDKFTKYFIIAVDCYNFCMLLISLKNSK